MRYYYYCEKDCTIDAYSKSPADGFFLAVPKECKRIKDEPLIWEVEHEMMEDPKITCPVCTGPAAKSLRFSNATFTFRGNWAMDKAGCKREMDLYKLANPQDNDYDKYYEPGERDHIRSTLIKTGRKAMRNKQVPVAEKAVIKRMAKKKNTVIRVGG